MALTACALGLAFAASPVAQIADGQSRQVDSDGPAAPGFDITRFSSAGNGWFETFYVTDTMLLRDALAAGRVGFSLTVPGTEVFGQ